jgi:hypothetical protein
MGCAGLRLRGCLVGLTAGLAAGLPRPGEPGKSLSPVFFFCFIFCFQFWFYNSNLNLLILQVFDNWY